MKKIVYISIEKFEKMVLPSYVRYYSIEDGILFRYQDIGYIIKEEFLYKRLEQRAYRMYSPDKNWKLFPMYDSSQWHFILHIHYEGEIFAGPGRDGKHHEVDYYYDMIGKKEIDENSFTPLFDKYYIEPANYYESKPSIKRSIKNLMDRNQVEYIEDERNEEWVD